jgi:hypothetical protein
MLLARRLIESGVRLVTLITGRRIDQAWDTPRQHFGLLKRSLCPPFDQAISALLEDMAERGLLSETLVVIVGDLQDHGRAARHRGPRRAEPAAHAGAGEADPGAGAVTCNRCEAQVRAVAPRSDSRRARAFSRSVATARGVIWQASAIC